MSYRQEMAHVTSSSGTAAANTAVTVTQAAVTGITPAIVYIFVSFTGGNPAAGTAVELLVNGSIVHTLVPAWGSDNHHEINLRPVNGTVSQSIAVRLQAGGGSAVGHVFAQFSHP